MRITILGSGNVGSALGKAWAKTNHQIVFGVKDPDDLKHESFKKTKNIEVKSVNDACKETDIVVLAVPWKAVKQCLKIAGNLKDRILVDCTNPIKPDFSGLEVGHTTSGAEMIAEMIPTCRVTKCFNHVGTESMINPKFAAGRPVQFVAGDDEEACEKTAQLARDAGFEAVKVGGLVLSRQLEQLAWLWIHMAYKGGMGKDIAFALMRK